MTPATWPIIASDATATVAALHRACFAPGWSDAAVGALLAGTGTIALLAGAEPAAAPVGFALFRSIGEEAEVLALGVAPEARRQRIAAALLIELCGRAARLGARRVVLEVAATNAAALALYRRHGFTIIGVRCGYFARFVPPVDGLTMARSLEVTRRASDLDPGACPG
ncbi:MAG: GNAT family N-acetyltransferase [Alphaproteobacteria bacterium]|nr:GNAT family N-acetyltransferase [Alphaproteobacteria bacterium]